MMKIETVEDLVEAINSGANIGEIGDKIHGMMPIVNTPYMRSLKAGSEVVMVITLLYSRKYAVFWRGSWSLMTELNLMCAISEEAEKSTLTLEVAQYGDL